MENKEKQGKARETALAQETLRDKKKLTQTILLTPKETFDPKNKEHACPSSCTKKAGARVCNECYLPIGADLGWMGVRGHGVLAWARAGSAGRG